MLKKTLLIVVIFLLASTSVYAFQIEDGGGSGRKATVEKDGDDGHLAVNSVRESVESHVSHKFGETYFLSSGASNQITHTATATGGYVLYLENESTTNNLYIEKIMFVSKTAGLTFALMKNPTLGTISNHNTMTPANVNFASGNVADCTAYTWNETGNGMGGITSGTTIITISVAAAPAILPIDGSILLKANDILGVQVFGAGEIVVSTRFYFKED